MTRYHADVDLHEVNSSHSLVVDLVGEDVDVLDVGCATGYLGAVLARRGCRVVGIEVDPAAAAEAREVLTEVVEADVDGAELDLLVGERRFDVVVLADVLEHLVHPEPVLRSAARVLKPGGSVVVSVPNVTHGSLRLALLQGRWEYRDTGLLDRTHLRFYTRAGLVGLVEDCGYHVTELRGTVADVLGGEVDVDADALPAGVVSWARAQDDATTYQFVLRATPGPGPHATRLEPAVELPEVRDEHSVSARLSRVEPVTDDPVELRRRMLVLRDHAIGAEVSLGRLRARVDELRAELDESRAETALCREDVIETHERLRRALEDLGTIRSTPTWRVGAWLTAPARILRNLAGGRRGA